MISCECGWPLREDAMSRYVCDNPNHSVEITSRNGIDILCDAGKYLCESRGINVELKLADLNRVNDKDISDAIKIIALSICEISGSSPTWRRRFIEEM